MTEDKELITKIVLIFTKEQPKLVKAIAQAIWLGETVQQIEAWAKTLQGITDYTLNNILLIAEYFETGDGAKLLPPKRADQQVQSI